MSLGVAARPIFDGATSSPPPKRVLRSDATPAWVFRVLADPRIVRKHRMNLMALAEDTFPNTRERTLTRRSVLLAAKKPECLGPKAAEDSEGWTAAGPPRKPSAEQSAGAAVVAGAPSGRGERAATSAAQVADTVAAGDDAGAATSAAQVADTVSARLMTPLTSFPIPSPLPPPRLQPTHAASRRLLVSVPFPTEDVRRACSNQLQPGLVCHTSLVICGVSATIFGEGFSFYWHERHSTQVVRNFIRTDIAVPLMTHMTRDGVNCTSKTGFIHVMVMGAPSGSQLLTWAE